MASWAIGHTLLARLCYSAISAQLILRLPQADRTVFNPVAGYNWLQFLGRIEIVNFNELEEWAHTPWHKTILVACFYGLIIAPYRLGVLTRNQDGRCIFLSIIVTIKACSVFAHRLPVLDVILMITVFWVMAGCPNACTAKMADISAILSEPAVKKLADESVAEVAKRMETTMEVIRAEMAALQTDRAEQAEQAEQAVLACTEIVGNLQETYPEAAEDQEDAIKPMLMILMGKKEGDQREEEHADISDQSRVREDVSMAHGTEDGFKDQVDQREQD